MALCGIFGISVLQSTTKYKRHITGSYHSGMVVLMMCIWEMGMGMYQRFVPVPMPMLFAQYYREIVFMLMVFIMGVFMLMFQCSVLVFMGMVFCQMQPDPHRHQQPRYQQRRCDGFAQ